MMSSHPRRTSTTTGDPAASASTSAAMPAGLLDSLSSFDETAPYPDQFGIDEPDFTNWANDESPPYDGNLYSTPLSWDPPAKVEEPLALPPAQFSMNALTPAMQEKLRSIAMPTHLQYNETSPESTTSYKSNSASSPETHDSQSRKRKSSAEAEDDDEELGDHPPVKKTAHNMIEKRYRTNLNDKISLLRDSVPSLRIMQKSARGEDTANDREELQGLTPAHKLNKATILSKAIEYIKHLEKRNSRLADDNNQMKTRIGAFEKLFVSGSMGFAPVQPTNPYYQDNVYTPGPSPTAEAQCMVPNVDNIRRLQTQMNNPQMYQVPQQFDQQPRGANGWQTGGGYFGKLMVGTMAGLMVVQGFGEAEQTTNTPNARGLGAIPMQAVRALHSMLDSRVDIHVSGYRLPAYRILDFLKISMMIGLVLAVFLPSFLKPKPKSKVAEPSALPAVAPPLASPITVRNQAWLTATQTVWVPLPNFFLEACALVLKIFKFSLYRATRTVNVFGGTEEQETARIKAWTIALDAQLAGGDLEINKSRLMLTLLASGTLPDTPARLMLKALHVRVFLWELGNSGWKGVFMYPQIAANLARWKWNEARSLNKEWANTHQDDLLPEHLAALLEQECDDVLTDCIGQRAYNLARNLPTIYNTEADEGMDAVVDDLAIRSPLDAVAAWYSSLLLSKALSKSLDDDVVSTEGISKLLDIAINTAPAGSGAQVRALAGRSVLVREKRGASIAATIKAIGPMDHPVVSEAVSLIDIGPSTGSLPDIKLVLRCAMAIAHIDRYPMPSSPAQAYNLINSIAPVSLTLLGFTALFKLMESMHGHSLLATKCARQLEKLSGGLRIWIGGEAGERSGLETEIKKEIVDRCLTINKEVLGMVEYDDGYESDPEGDVGC